MSKEEEAAARGIDSEYTPKMLMSDFEKRQALRNRFVGETLDEEFGEGAKESIQKSLRSAIHLGYKNPEGLYAKLSGEEKGKYAEQSFSYFVLADRNSREWPRGAYKHFAKRYWTARAKDNHDPLEQAIALSKAYALEGPEYVKDDVGELDERQMRDAVAEGIQTNLDGKSPDEKWFATKLAAAYRILYGDKCWDEEQNTLLLGLARSEANWAYSTHSHHQIESDDPDLSRPEMWADAAEHIATMRILAADEICFRGSHMDIIDASSAEGVS